ncbi:MAG: EAL domain-containing protein [Pseudomonadota bacterium]|nr:EAL domain-containing protein [Pseudomonadota bacterium]
MEPHKPCEQPAAPTLPPIVSLQGAAMNQAANAMFIADRMGRICWINRAFSELYGYGSGDICGQTPRKLKSGRQTSEFYGELWRAISSGEVWRGQLNNRKSNGEVIDVEQTITPLRRDDGKVTHYLAVYEDITHRLRSERTMARLVMFDSLTGLPNRSNFRQRLTEALARAQRKGKPVAVMMLDLDHFKSINDTIGHAGGDELLVQLAARMQSIVRTSDTVARLSGDEFAIIAEDLDRPEQTLESAQRLLDVVREPVDIQGHSVRVGASIGIALSGVAGDGPEQLLHNADLAMYQAKSSGRGRAQFFDAGMNAAARYRYEIERALRSALRDDVLNMVYQPQVSMESGRIVGAEALARWNDAEHGPVPPEEFVQLAEQTGLIFALNDWVLRQVIKDLALMQKRCSSPVPVAINLSAGHFDNLALAPNIRALLDEFEVPPDIVRIEITETVMLRSSTTVNANLRSLAGMGLSIGIDDFGTGYSSLPSLRDFPIDYIKLDRSYVSGIDRSAKDKLILNAIISLARAMGLEVIAEGVETAEQTDFLIAAQCLLGQGYRFSPGVPLPEFLSMLEVGSIAAHAVAPSDLVRNGPAMPARHPVLR